MGVKLSKTRFPNLFCSESGVYYLRARTPDGKRVLRSLRSQDGVPVRNERLARIMVVEELNRIGNKFAVLPGFGRDGDGSMSWGMACDEWLGRLLARPDLSVKSKEAKRYEVEFARGVFEGKLDLVHRDVFARWWSSFPATRTKSGVVSVRTCNKVLDVVKAVSAWAFANGLCSVDGAFELKHLPVADRFKVVPPVAVLREVVVEVRRSFGASACGRRADAFCESAFYIEFLAYSGARHAEARVFCWEDVSGDGVVIHGVKRGRDRFVPFNSGLLAVVNGLRVRVEEAGGVCRGLVFGIVSPRLALERACKRLGVAGLNLHGLRHFFITCCMEAGVLPATIARWVGHVDGGVLIAKTYTHIRDDHSRAEARKLVF